MRNRNSVGVNIHHRSRRKKKAVKGEGKGEDKGGGKGEGKEGGKGGGGETDWQYKGTGKGGSLGQAVGSGSTVVEEAKKKEIPPATKANTKAAVEEMFNTGYYKFPETPFWDGLDTWKIVKGTHCLWKNVGTGKNGGESTKTEMFHGEVHGWEKEDVIVS